MHQIQLELMLTALSTGGLSLEEVWLDYCALGGRRTEAHMERFLQADQGRQDAEADLGDLDRDILAHAINQMFQDRDLPDCVPYVLDSMGGDRPRPKPTPTRPASPMRSTHSPTDATM